MAKVHMKKATVPLVKKGWTKAIMKKVKKGETKGTVLVALLNLQIHLSTRPRRGHLGPCLRWGHRRLDLRSQPLLVQSQSQNRTAVPEVHQASFVLLIGACTVQYSFVFQCLSSLWANPAGQWVQCWLWFPAGSVPPCLPGEAANNVPPDPAAFGGTGAEKADDETCAADPPGCSVSRHYTCIRDGEWRFDVLHFKF